MQLFMLLSGIISFGIFILAFHHFLKKVRYNRHLGIDLSVIIIGLSYLVLSVVFFLWSRGIFEFGQADFLIVYSIILLLQTVSLVAILYHSNKNKKVLYSMISFLLIIPFLIFDISYFHLVIPLCFFVILLSFLAFSNNSWKTISYLIAYSSFSLMAHIIIILYNPLTIKLFLFSGLLFLIFFYHFLEQLRNNSRPFLPAMEKKENPIISFLKHFIFIIIITNFIFIGTIGFHELGHLFMASTIEDCSGNRIVYEVNGFPHTEVTCKDDSSKELWIIAGLMLPIIIASLLFFGGGIYIKELALEIFGFNLAISYIDFIDLGLSKTLSSFLMFLGVVLCALSLALLARSRTQ